MYTADGIITIGERHNGGWRSNQCSAVSMHQYNVVAVTCDAGFLESYPLNDDYRHD